MERVQVENVTRGVVLVQAAEVAASPWQRLRGLLGRARLLPGEGLLIRPSQGVHSFFMHFAIDVVYVNGDGEIVDMLAPLRPGRMGPLVPAARWVLELPAGTLLAARTMPGDRLAVRPVAQPVPDPKASAAAANSGTVTSPCSCD